MSKTIVLAVDVARSEPARHIRAAADLVRELAKADDEVVVLHVHEFAVGRFGRIRVDCADDQGDKLVADVVADLSRAGLAARGLVREADYGHVARAIIAAARAVHAGMIVLGSGSRTDLPPVPLGSVANRLLHIAAIPVLIVPRQRPAELPAMTLRPAWVESAIS